MDQNEIIRESFQRNLFQDMNINMYDKEKERTIEMENTYLNSKGEAIKKEKLAVEYIETIIQEVNEYILLKEYCIKDAAFYNGSKNDEVTKLNFAINLKVPYFIYNFKNYIDNMKMQEKKRSFNENVSILQAKHMEFFNILDKLPKFPTYALLMMLLNDIISFDLISSQIVSSAYLNYEVNKEYQLINLDKLENNMGYLNSHGNTIFKNGEFIITFLGITFYENKTCLIIRYQCLDSKLNSHENFGNTDMDRVGTSHYDGYLFLDSKNGQVVMGNMRENIISIQSTTFNNNVTKSKSNCIRSIKLT